MSSEQTSPVTWQTQGQSSSWTLTQDAQVFGLGDKAKGFDRRGQSFELWNTDAYGWKPDTDPLYKSIPFLLVLDHGRAHGFFFDSPARAQIDVGKSNHQVVVRDEDCPARGTASTEFSRRCARHETPPRVRHRTSPRHRAPRWRERGLVHQTPVLRNLSRGLRLVYSPPMSLPDHAVIQRVLDFSLEKSRRNREGEPASYIPELALVPLERTSAAVTLRTGETLHAGDALNHDFTFQSSAKLLTLIGLLEERGPVEVFDIVGSEPSGDSFGSVARLETHGPKPANPLINSGAIALCGQLRGNVERRVAWLLRWAERLYGKPMQIDQKVLANERISADRNRAIAYYLKHGGVLKGDVNETLDVYFALCSLSAGVREAAHLPAILANGGLLPGSAERVLSKQTVAIVVSIMATCGMYNESGNYLTATGMPAKSGVSGVIVAVVPGTAGIAVSSPRLNDKGGSVRGHLILRELSRQLGWHFALSADRSSTP